MNRTRHEQRKPVVLLVDDDRDLLDTTAAVLEDDFRVVAAGSAAEALVLFAAHDVDIVCTDYELGAVNGMELLRITIRQREHVGGVLISGHDELSHLGGGPRTQDHLLLAKPYAPAALIDLLQKVANHAQLMRGSLPEKSNAN